MNSKFLITKLLKNSKHLRNSYFILPLVNRIKKTVDWWTGSWLMLFHKHDPYWKLLYSVCIISPWPADGNITCTDAVSSRGKFLVKSGNKCFLGNTRVVILDLFRTLSQRKYNRYVINLKNHHESLQLYLPIKIPVMIVFWYKVV